MAMAPLTPPPLSVPLTSFTVGSLTPFPGIKNGAFENVIDTNYPICE